jgi:hypothetical protein
MAQDCLDGVDAFGKLHQARLSLLKCEVVDEVYMLQEGTGDSEM